MNRCKTCKHFNNKAAQDLKYISAVAASGGYCESKKIHEELGGSRYESDALVYSYNEGGRFWVGANFGCVHHSKNNL